MNIGDKIKRLRNEKLMTQSELAGSVITRNMLSCIENGSASPSLSTLKHIAARLNVPVGYLLAEGEDEMIYAKLSQISNIKNAYLSGNYKICRDIWAESDIEADDEVYLILAECALSLGVEAFNNGQLRTSCEFFDEAIEISGKTIYNTDHICAMSASYFRYMRYISATLSSNMIDEEDQDIFLAMGDDFSRYMIAFDFFEQKGGEIARHMIASLEENLSYRLHIEAKLLMEEGKYEEAYKKLYMILITPHKIQEPLMYFVFCDLEVCCKEKNDFKGAYEYSIDKMEVLQKMLTEN